MKTKIGILSFLLTIVIVGSAIFSPLKAVDTASLLPPGVSQFFDNNGNPLSSGYLYTYDAGTSTLRTTWKDSAETLPNTNPIRLDAGGKAIVYGSGTYRTVLKDRNGNLIWDAVTAPGGGGSTPTLVGDGNLVGTVLPWSGLVAPNQYVFAYGQEIARGTYPTFYTAVTQQLTVICSAASNILTGVSDTSQVKIGSAVELALCVVAGTTVTAKTAATITLSNPSSVSINSTATFFPWGNGNGTTTFNVPDFRGYVLAGRDNMGGTAAARLTTTYFNPGGTSNPDALGAAGGTQSHTQTISELAAHTHTVNDPGHIHSTAGSSINLGGATMAGTSAGAAQTIVSASATTGITNNTTGSSTPFSVVQPTITLNYIVKITPDTSTSIATGVYSIGGMTGVISCGSGLSCTGNIINSLNASAGGASTEIQVNSGGNFTGYPALTFISPDTLSLGVSGVTGKFKIYGSTSGNITQQAQAVAATPTVTWGTSSGTPAVTASSPLAIASATGNATCSTCVTASSNKVISNNTVSLTGSNPTVVPTGLTTINNCNLTLVQNTTPGVSTSVLTYTISTASINIYGWKTTTISNNTYINSTGTESVSWSCIGT